MTIGSIVTALPWAAAVSCCFLAASGYVRMARTDGGWRDSGCWYGPLVFTAASFALLTVTGVLPVTAGAFLTLAPLAVIGVRASRLWREAVKGKLGMTRATLLVLSLLWDRTRDALWNAREDLRDLGGMLHRAPAPAAGGPAPAVRPAPASFRRRVPSLRDDTLRDEVPAVAGVAADLEAARVTVPPAWAALAAEVTSFEAEDADDLDEHMAREAAGLLTYADAVTARAENLAAGAGLDPAIIAGHLEFADEVADLASVVALVVKRTRDLYVDLQEFAERGGVMPHNARRWFNAGGPGDGQAA